MFNHIEPYLLAPSALTATALLQRADALLADPAVAVALATGDRASLIRSNLLYDAWLMRWSPGDATDLHAHDGSFGAYAVLSGVFREVAGDAALRERVVRSGERIAYRPGYPHRLTSVAGDTVTLHLSSPPRAAAPRLVPASAAVAS